MSRHVEVVLRHGVLPDLRQPEANLRGHPSVGAPEILIHYTVAAYALYRRDLEKAVENLSQLLEEPIEAETVKSLRSRIVDKTVMSLHLVVFPRTDGLCRSMYEAGTKSS